MSQHTFCCFNMFILMLLDFFKHLAQTGIIATMSGAVLLQLVADKDHPEFREIQNLVKPRASVPSLLSKV